MIYSRIVKYRKTDARGNKQEILPSIKVNLYSTRTNAQYDLNTWELCKDDEQEDLNNYIYTVPENEEQKKYKKPNLDSGYLKEKYILTYNEEAYFENKRELFDLQPMEILEPVLMTDEEILILGYPTQYILMYFKNRIGVMVNMIDSGDFEKHYAFKIQDYPHYEK